MKLEILFTALPLALVAIIFQFLPLLTRRGIFFSATVDPEFPQSADGRRLLRSYRLQAALWTLIAIALGLVLAPQHPEYAALAPALLLVMGISVSYWMKFREVHERYGEHRPEIRRAELSPRTSGEAFSAWLWLPPFLALAAIGVYLQAHWNLLPERFPVHWGVDGQPNRWASRTWSGVYGPLLIGAGLNLFMLGVAWLVTRQSRKTAMQRIMVRLSELLLYPMTFASAAAAVLPLVSFPIWLIPVVMTVSIAAVIYWAYRQISVPTVDDATPEPQSDSYWRAGMFYYNPNDPAIFVSKRVGIGYTMNFANKISWVVLVGILLMALLPVLLIRK
jgi:uncharacterized membrane protein